MNNLEDLIIYKQFVELIYYTNMITKKFPKVEKFSLVTEILNSTYKGMESIIISHRLYKKNDKLEQLGRLDIKLKYLRVLIRVSYKNKYINVNNYNAWSKKISNIGNLLGGWINGCQRQ